LPNSWPWRSAMAAATCHPDKKNVGFGLCKPCYRKNYYARNKDREKKWRRDLVDRSPLAISVARHQSHVVSTYGVSWIEYVELFRRQHGRCAICGEKEMFGDRRLCLDHSHNTGKIRGLLCSLCNSAIGKLGDDPSVLRNAYAYLLAHMENDNGSQIHNVHEVRTGSVSPDIPSGSDYDNRHCAQPQSSMSI
jgi:hypothetical protein